MTLQAPLLTLNNGVTIPQLGLGVFRSPVGQATIDTVSTALELGYRHIDTAQVYGNEADVGRAIRASGVPRDQVFVTTKLWRDDVDYDRALRAIDQSLQKLGLDYVDLYLIHWPTQHTRRDGWRAMERIYEEGKARAIGVSNYMAHHLTELKSYANVLPAVNQIELSPYNFRSREVTIGVCRELNIRVESYSPLTKGWRLGDEKLVAVAQRYGKTPAQILIRYIIEKDMIVLPKSNRRERLIENAAVYDFSLNAADVELLDGFDEDLTTGWDPSDAP